MNLLSVILIFLLAEIAIFDLCNMYFHLKLNKKLQFVIILFTFIYSLSFIILTLYSYTATGMAGHQFCYLPGYSRLFITVGAAFIGVLMLPLFFFKLLGHISAKSLTTLGMTNFLIFFSILFSFYATFFIYPNVSWGYPLNGLPLPYFFCHNFQQPQPFRDPLAHDVCSVNPFLGISAWLLVFVMLLYFLRKINKSLLALIMFVPISFIVGYFLSTDLAMLFCT